MTSIASSTPPPKRNQQQKQKTRPLAKNWKKVESELVAINTSPGTSEVIIYAALYLRLKKSPNSEGESRGIKAARIADIVMAKRKSKRDLLVKLLTMSEREMDEVVFMRPLHVRLKFKCDLHPKGDNTKDILRTLPWKLAYPSN